jgi:hypothetical protein
MQQTEKTPQKIKLILTNHIHNISRIMSERNRTLHLHIMTSHSEILNTRNEYDMNNHKSNCLRTFRSNMINSVINTDLPVSISQI